MTRSSLQFDDMMISETERYSLGVERNSGAHYISVQISAQLVDYEEYYELTEEEFFLLLDDPEAGQTLARRCRDGHEAARLFSRPGGPGGAAT
ncbi:hypothetical protein [Methylopila sp. M107]|uniref:hypothetical protein n=1 Tax=Methylopila sp. M107 TaxID=1101190 RepID=UPI0003787825|nr:hypothetical protein [Methylopila sp. M107]